MPGLPAGMEWVVIAVVALLLFGGTAGARLAGLGKGAGRAIREFKEETQNLKEKDTKDGAPSEPPSKAVEKNPTDPTPETPSGS